MPPGYGLPLVWSGASRTLAQIRDVRGDSKGARAAIHARGLKRKPKNKKTSMREEMLRVTEDEIRTLNAVANKTFDIELRKAQRGGLRTKRLNR